MKVRKLYDHDVELLRTHNLALDDDEGTFDDNWIVSAGDLFGRMSLPEEEFETPIRLAA